MGQEREKKGARTGKKRGRKRVGTGSETGFKRQKNGISPNSTIWNGVERPFLAVPHLSCRFLAVPPRFSPAFHDFGQKREKNGCPKMEERERKERVSFLFLSRFPFFPFLAWHISNWKVQLLKPLVRTMVPLQQQWTATVAQQAQMAWTIGTTGVNYSPGIGVEWLNNGWNNGCHQQYNGSCCR